MPSSTSIGSFRFVPKRPVDALPQESSYDEQLENRLSQNIGDRIIRFVSSSSFE